MYHFCPNLATTRDVSPLLVFAHEISLFFICSYLNKGVSGDHCQAGAAIRGNISITATVGHLRVVSDEPTLGDVTRGKFTYRVVIYFIEGFHLGYD